MDEISNSLDDLKFTSNFNPALFFSAGEALNDKDRDLNFDSLQIQKFFKPIDNLWGDYEVRKKFEYHEKLYLDKFNNETFKLSIREEPILPYADLATEECKIDDKYKVQTGLFLFYLYVDFKNSKYILDSEFTKNYSFDHVAERLTAQNEIYILQIFALDPEKLIQCANYDLTRFKHNVDLLVNNEKAITEQEAFNFFQKIYNKRKTEKTLKVDFYEKDSISAFLEQWGLEDTTTNQKILKCFMSRKYKFKNYE